MDSLDVPKKTFMSNHCNYYYDDMPFSLKNAKVIYQPLMDAIFSHHIGWNLEVYVDKIIMKTTEGRSHVADLEDVL